MLIIFQNCDGVNITRVPSSVLLQDGLSADGGWCWGLGCLSLFGSGAQSKVVMRELCKMKVVQRLYM